MSSARAPGGSPGEAHRLHLVRHAHAFPRKHWTGDDAKRPLSELGAAQAQLLARRLVRAGIGRLVTSPALRCRATLRPLAADLGLELELEEALAEGRSGGEALVALLALLAGGGSDLVACTHGDVLGALLQVLEGTGVAFASPPELPKAGTWELWVEGGRVAHARLVPPPTVLV